MLNNHKKEVVIGVVGLGYVGLPLAVAFAKKIKTIGFDINARRIEELKSGLDRTLEIASAELKDSPVEFCSELNALKRANFFVVTVPTPVNDAKQPDLAMVRSATRTIAKVLKPGDCVVYESTVYPGTTEEECIPILEADSGLKCIKDFYVGYSPERINPGDKEHTFTKIKKVVSGINPEACDLVAQVYGSVVEAGVFKAQSIKVAEAAKVIENTQRDLNIALMNELALIFDRMDIDTEMVLQAAGTKWNFLPFKPGLVGGHCIGVDPYYLTYKAEVLNYHPEVILAGRRINDGMGSFIAQTCVREIVRNGGKLERGSRVTILGFTFKENCPDIRNTKVIDIYNELKTFGFDVEVADPVADVPDAQHEYGITFTSLKDIKPSSAVIVAVAHSEFKKLSPRDLKNLLLPNGVVIDVKSLFSPESYRAENIPFWRL